MLDQGLQALVRVRVLEVVETVHGERGTDGLNVLPGLGDACFADFADDIGHNDRGEQTHDDHYDHDLDEREAAGAGNGVRIRGKHAHGVTRVVRGAANGGGS